MDTRPNPLTPYLQRIAGVKPRVLEIPEALHVARRSVAEADRALAATKKRRDEAKDAVKDSELEIASGVAGKNEAERKAAAAAALKQSAAHRALLTTLATLDAEVMQVEHAWRLQGLDVKKLEDEQRAYQTYADFTLSETALLTAGR